MQHFKDKLYNYQITPPSDLWSKIESDLDDQKVIQLPGIRKKSSFLFYGITAAAAIIILLISGIFFSKENKTQTVANIQPAAQIKSTSPTVTKDSILQNQEILESIINTKKNNHLIAAVTPARETSKKEYITIAGPEGQPVKISQKAATLIISADDEYPPKAKWDKQIDEWQQIMLDNMLSPTPTNLMDIMQKAANLE